MAIASRTMVVTLCVTGLLACASCFIITAAWLQ
jgi:hypothetical protein